MKEKLSSVISAAIIVEALITYFKTIYVGGEISWSIVASIFLGISVAVIYKLDLLKDLKLSTKLPYISNILTGVLIARGSNYLFDLIGNFTTK